MRTSDWSRRRFLSVVGASLAAGCGYTGGSRTPIATPPHEFTPDAGWQAPADSPVVDVSTTVLVENLEIPWDIAVAPDGDLFVTERVGRVNRFASGDLKRVVAPDDAIDAGSIPPGSDERPWWVRGGEGGTMGVAVHPNYPDSPFVFVYYTARDYLTKENRLVRFDALADDPAATETVLVDGIPADRIHNGGRLTFGPEGYLWLTTGEAGDGARAQDLGSLAGKVLRVTVEGEPAPDNPDLGDGADSRIYTYGHRNPQGVVWLPDGTAVISEHGPGGHDEVNRLVSGGNYGWPDIRTREEYTASSDVRPPLLSTGPSTAWAPSGSCFYTGDAVPAWRNRLLVGALGSQQVVVVTLTPPGQEPPPADDDRRFDADWYDDTYTATAHPVLQNELGRVRHVEQGLDGEVYAVTSNRDGRAKQPFPRERDDVLVRLEEAG